MSVSTLHTKISLCEAVESLTKQQCFDVIQLMQKESGCDTINQLLMKIIMKMDNICTIQSLCSLQKSIQQSITIQNESKQQQKPSISAQSQNTDIQLFPLPRLPVDIITQTSLFLNEEDIFNFERCCRLFYKMINNSSYLNKCNNFKEFQIRNETIDDIYTTVSNMNNINNGFFKYSTLDTMELLAVPGEDPDDNDVAKWRNQFGDKWSKIVNDDLFVGLLGSIKNLIVNDDSFYLMVNEIPFELLFDSTKSILENIEINGYVDETVTDEMDKSIVKLTQSCQQCQERLIQNNKSIKKFNRVIFREFYCGLLSMPITNMEKLVFNNTVVWPDYFINGETKYPYLNRLSIEQGLGVDIEDLHPNILLNLQRNNMNIDTLRLVNCESQVYLDFIDKMSSSQRSIMSMGEMLNLDNTLKNLTMVMYNKNKQLVECIESILCKKRYYYLTNVNILLDFGYAKDLTNGKDLIDSIFDVLKRNCGKLHNAFDNLYIGVNIRVEKKRFAQILKWNSTIDEKFLDQTYNFWSKQTQDDNLTVSNYQMFNKLNKNGNN